MVAGGGTGHNMVQIVMSLYFFDRRGRATLNSTLPGTIIQGKAYKNSIAVIEAGARSK